jgi:hypothetical protein
MADKQGRVAAIGVDKVVQAWETMNDGYPYFAVYYNHSNKYFQYNKDDIDQARDFLVNNLSVLQDNNDTAMYYLNIYPDKQPNYKNSGMIASFPFRLNALSSDSVMGGLPDNASMGAVVKMMNESNERHIALVREIAELKNANQPLDWYDKIAGIMETPGAANVIVPLLQPVIAAITGILSKVSGVPQQTEVPLQYAMVPGIAGPDIAPGDLDEKLDIQLDRLEKHGDLLEMLTALADFAEKSPEAFKGYLQMLTVGK